MNQYRQPSRIADRKAYSLLELMIALALLATLSTIAWSLLSTFRNAETRGWKVAYRTQLIQTTRDWIEEDLAHAVSDPASQPFFTGDALGFSIAIAPSLDPIPFFNRSLSPLASSAKLGMEQDDADTETLPTWPPKRVLVHYTLESLSRTPSGSSASSTNTKAPYRLIRRLESTSPAVGTPNSRPLGRDTRSIEEPLQTSSELYRQSPSSPLSSDSGFTSQLEGLVGAQFQYFDGNQWLTQWTLPSPPCAVLLSFDFASGDDLKEIHSQATTLPQPTLDPEEPEESVGLSDQDLVMEPESASTAIDRLAQRSIDASHDVHILVRFGSTLPVAGPSASAPTGVFNR